jgi:hypothetical protein
VYVGTETLHPTGAAAAPSGPTCWRRHRDWCQAGVWEALWAETVAALDAARRAAEAQRDRAGAARRPHPQT